MLSIVVLFCIFGALVLINYSIDKIIFKRPSVDISLYKTLTYESQSVKSILGKTYTDIYHEIKYNIITPKTAFEKYVIFSSNNIPICELYNSAINLVNKYNIGIITYDYCGMGLSEGKSSENSYTISLSKIVGHIKNQYNASEENIILIGEGIGAGVVVNFLDLNRRWNSPVVLISPFKSVFRLLLDFKIPFDRFPTIEKIGNIETPIQIIDSPGSTHGKQIYNKLNNKIFDLIIADWDTFDEIDFEGIL
jgi:hypothetical protein